MGVDGLYLTIAVSLYKMIMNAKLKSSFKKIINLKFQLINKQTKNQCNKGTNFTGSTRNGTERTQSNNCASNQSRTTSFSRANHPTTCPTTPTKPFTCPNTIFSSNHSNARFSQSCSPKPLSTRSCMIARSRRPIRKTWIQGSTRWICCHTIFPSLRKIIFWFLSQGLSVGTSEGLFRSMFCLM